MTFALWLTFNKPVGLSGLEPPTSRLSGVRSNQLSYKPISRNLLIPSGFSNAVSPNLGTSSSVMGILTCVQFRIHVRKQASFHSCVSCPRVRKILHGDEEIRTLDPLLARQVLSQLSYIPFFWGSGSHLLSHTVSSAVPSASWVLTVVFGMGTGVSPRRIAAGNLSLSLLPDNSTVKHISLLHLPF